MPLAHCPVRVQWKNKAGSMQMLNSNLSCPTGCRCVFGRRFFKCSARRVGSEVVTEQMKNCMHQLGVDL